MFKKLSACTGFGQRQVPVCAGKQPQDTLSAFVFEKLEPRLLLSADAVGAVVAADVLDDDAPQSFDNSQQLKAWLAELADSTPLPLKPAAEPAALDLAGFAADDSPIAIDAPAADQPLSLEGSDDHWQQQLSSLLDDEHAQRVELVFVDSSVANYQQLLAGLQVNEQVDYQVTLIDSNEDGIARISQQLQGQSGIDAIHLVTHGSDGAIQLGNTLLNNATLSQYGESLSAWQQALSAEADVLIYGCDVAATAVGEHFLEQFSSLLAVDIAASDDLTGNQQLGADWTLEYQQGLLETQLAFSTQIQQQWQGSLATFTVDTTADTIDANLGDGFALDASGNTSLRAAVMEANALAGSDTIQLGAGTYTLALGGASAGDTEGDLNISSNVTILGADAASTFIDGGNIDRVFQVQTPSGSLTLSDVTIQEGNIAGGQGGGIFVNNPNATATLNRVNITANQADEGGGIYNKGDLFLTDVSIAGNSTLGGASAGGGLYNWSEATLNNVTVSGNTANIGGGIYNDGTADLTYVTISGNTASVSEGGGIYNDFTANLLNVTIADNSAQTQGGGIFNNFNTNISNSIVGNNTAGGTGNDVFGTFASDGTNVIEDTAPSAVSFGGDTIGDPSLAPLADYGGFTQTHRLLSNSIAINAGTDAGAYEYNPGDTGLVVVTTTSWTSTFSNTSSIDALYFNKGLDGEISLLEAIIAVNNTPNVGGPDRILFDLPGSTTISPTSQIPDITDAVIIDGLAGSGQSSPFIEINGRFTSGDHGFVLNTSDSTIHGLAIHRFDNNGIRVIGNDNIITGNFIGTDKDGVDTFGNGLNGIWVEGTGTIIGGDQPGQANLIVSNDRSGILVDNTADTIIMGNNIGVNSAGNAAMGNDWYGIQIFDSANTQIGGSAANQGNLVSGNGLAGIVIYDGNSINNTVEGNFIGTNAAGNAAIGNGEEGILVAADASFTTIGGSAPGAGNLISGNSLDGVHLNGKDTTDNTLLGNLIGTAADGLAVVANGQDGIRIIDSSNNQIGGVTSAERNLISGNAASGIAIYNNRAVANVIEGNYIGTDLSGFTALGNGGDGITLAADASNNTIGGTAASSGNVISGNSAHGIKISDDNSTGNRVLGNFIGTTANGFGALGNGGHGVFIENARDNLIGGSTPAERNIISGNNGDGVAISGFQATDNLVQGNFIGTDINGTSTLSNLGSGVRITANLENSFGGADRNTIGGKNAGEGNLISGNWLDGVVITGNLVQYNTVQGNYIGSDVNGTGSLGNGLSGSGVGVRIADGAAYNLIGVQTSVSEGNLISANTEGGVLIDDADSNTIQGNKIGSDISGALSLANGASGIVIQNGASNNMVGGTSGLAANTIAFHAQSGVRVTESNSTGNTIRSNSIHSNTGLGIDLGGDDVVAANDIPANADGDSGANGLQNYPLLTAAVVNGVNISISGSINTTSDTDVDIDFFSSDSANTSGNGEGRVFLGTVTLLTDGSGDQTFDVNFSVPVAAGQFISATATTADGTSEFAANIVAVTTPNTAPTGSVTISGSAIEDQQLTASNDIADVDGISGSIAYQWQIDGENIAGATANTYTLGDADVGDVITVVASYVDGLGKTESVISLATAAVLNINDPLTGTVIISGTVEDNAVLTVSETLADDDGIPGSINLQWRADGTDIVGATDSSYQLTDAEVGKAITVLASYTDGQGTLESLESAATGLVAEVNDPVTGSVTIPATAADNAVLTASHDIADEDGIASISYQWFNDGGAIAGATAVNYTVTDTDVGQQLYVQATVTDDLANVEVKTSNLTTAVTETDDPVTGSVTIPATAADNAVLTASHDFADEDGIASISYQWFNDGGAIAGATAVNYTVTDNDVGQQLYVQATVTDNLANVEVKTSNLTTAVTETDDPVTGSVTIPATAADNAVLTASHDFADEDGIASISYQWFNDGGAITGATAVNYTVTDTDVSQQLYVQATVTDHLANVEVKTSNLTSAVTDTNDLVTGAVTIPATAADNAVLTASHDFADEDGIASISYQWFNDGGAIGGATAVNYTVTDTDVGQQLYVQATVTDDLANVEVKTSNLTAAVTETNDPLTGSISIPATAADNAVLTASHDFADEDGIASISYQWFNDGGAITGATAVNYTITDTDVGQQLYVQATVLDNAGNSELKTSNSTSLVVDVNDPVSGSLTISGLAEEDQQLTASQNFTDQDGLGAIAYQWQRNGVDIAGATATSYRLGDADVGSSIRVIAAYIDQAGNPEQVISAASGAVANINDSPQGNVTISGNAELDQLLTASHNLSDDDGLGTIAYQWQRGGVDIVGATNSSYQVTAADQLNTLSVRVSYVDGNNSSESVSSSGVLVARQIAKEIAEASQINNKPKPVGTAASTEADAGSGSTATETQDQQSEDTAADKSADTQVVEVNVDLDSLLNHRAGANDLNGNNFASDGVNGAGIEKPRGIETASGINRASAEVTTLQAKTLNKLDAGFASLSMSISGLDSVFSSLNDPMNLVSSSKLKNSLDEVQQQMQDNLQLTQTIIGGSVAVSGGISVGYVVWLVRSGAILSSVMSALPAWRFIDPLPILSAANGDGTGDDETLQSMVGDEQADNQDQGDEDEE